jgi:hypothetical protein
MSGTPLLAVGLRAQALGLDSAQRDHERCGGEEDEPPDEDPAAHGKGGVRARSLSASKIEPSSCHSRYSAEASQTYAHGRAPIASGG